LENYIVFSSTANIPFTYKELMAMPIFMINDIYDLCEKEYTRKAKNSS